MLNLIFVSILMIQGSRAAGEDVSSEGAWLGTFAQVESTSGAVTAAVRIFRDHQRRLKVHYWKGGVVRHVGLIESDLAEHVDVPGPAGQPFRLRLENSHIATLRMNWDWTELIYRARHLRDDLAGQSAQYSKQLMATVDLGEVGFEDFRAGSYATRETAPFTECELRLMK